MKVFGNSSGKHVRKDDPAPRRDPAVSAPKAAPAPAARSAAPVREEKAPSPAPVTPPSTAARPAASEPPRPVQPAAVRRPQPQPVSETPPSGAKPAGSAAPPASVPPKPPKQKGRFWTGYLIFVLAFLVIIGAGLTVLWLRMDAYERSRPYRPMDALMASTSADGWRSQLSNAGVESSFLDTLDFGAANYTKKLGDYSDEQPVYSIRFGKKTMLTAILREGAALRFGFHAWEVDSLTLVPSGLTVFVPENATLKRNGVPVGEECIAARNAQSVELGPLESGRDDIPGLTKYVLDHCYAADGITVTDAVGNTLELGMQKGKSYYYPPLTPGYVIEAPSDVTVTVNGLELTEENAEITRVPLEDFDGLGDSVPVHPADVTYVIDGLVAVPEVQAAFADGSPLTPVEVTEDRWTFRLMPDRAFGAAQEEYILKVFDAYIAFLGNRNGDLNGNYRRYLAYLVPGSEAASRAEKSLASLYWVQGRDTTLEAVTVGDVMCYGDACFTAWLDFTRRLLDGGEDNASYLFLFVRYNNEWRVVRVMNKTSFIR